MHDELSHLWERTLGNPPTPAQFAIWAELHSLEVIKRAILRTATKNIQMGGTMSQDYRVRYASKAMLTTDTRAVEHATNRARLEAEFGAASDVTLKSTQSVQSA